MKRAFLKFMLFLLPLLALALGFELRLRHSPSYYGLKHGYFLSVRESVRVLVLGASQANQGIEPGLLDSHAFNLAHVGQDIFYDRALLKASASQMPALKLVILPVSYVSLEYCFPGTPEEWRTFCYGIHWGLSNEVFRNNFDLRQYSLLALTEPLKALQQIAGVGVKDQYLATRPDGFLNVAPLDKDMFRYIINALTSRKRVLYHHSVMGPEKKQSNLEILKEIMDFSKARGWAAVLVTTPVYKDYADSIDRRRWAVDQALIRGLAGKEGVAYWDYFDDRSFEREDFSDVDHLNVRGAVKFTGKLRRRLVRAGLL